MSNEKQLVEACIQDNRAAQQQFYELYAGKLFALARRYMKDKDDAQDVLQDAFIKIFKHINTFRFDCPLEAWLKRIVINTALKAIQKNGQMKMEDIDTHSGFMYDSPTNLGLENLSMEALNAIIQTLPEGCKTVFNLYAVEGYKHQEIAEMLNITEGTSKSQFSRARQLLMLKINKETLRIYSGSNPQKN